MGNRHSGISSVGGLEFLSALHSKILFKKTLKGDPRSGAALGFLKINSVELDVPQGVSVYLARWTALFSLLDSFRLDTLRPKCPIHLLRVNCATSRFRQERVIRLRSIGFGVVG